MRLRLVARAEVAADPERQRRRVTNIVAMDCEMVGVGAAGRTSVLARCTVVNFEGEVLYDSFVQTVERVTGATPAFPRAGVRADLGCCARLPHLGEWCESRGPVPCAQVY